MSMFVARFAVFVRRARVLPSPCRATFVICCSGGFTGTLLFQLVVHWTGFTKYNIITSTLHSDNRRYILYTGMYITLIVGSQGNKVLHVMCKVDRTTAYTSAVSIE